LISRTFRCSNENSATLQRICRYSIVYHPYVYSEYHSSARHCRHSTYSTLAQLPRHRASAWHGYAKRDICLSSWHTLVLYQTVKCIVNLFTTDRPILTFLPARRYASAGYRDRNVSVCLSVRLSVTRWYCVKTKKASVIISSPSDSPKTLVF